jgi:hypothetical protein
VTWGQKSQFSLKIDTHIEQNSRESDLSDPLEAIGFPLACRI